MTLVSRKQLIRRALAAGALLAASVAAMPSALAADDLPLEDDIGMPGPPPLAVEPPPPRPYTDGPYMQRPYEQSPYAPPPPVRYQQSALDSRPVLPPYQIVTVLRSTGYSPLGPVTRRGWVYTVAVLNPNGDDGRLIIDARNGQIMRFIPAMAVDERLNESMAMAYGPPGPPPQDVRYETRRGSLLDLRRSPRPAVAVPNTAQRNGPKVANRGPASAPIPAAAKPVAAAPAQAATPVQQAAENKSVAATAGVAKPSAPQPSTPQLWPTQAMPEVQLLE